MLSYGVALARAGGVGLPKFVEQEFRQFLTCGVLASQARWRPRVVAAPSADITALDTLRPPGYSDGEPPAPLVCPGHWAWAQLMRPAFDVDVPACPRCGGRLRLVATVTDPRVIRSILADLGLPPEVPLLADVLA